MSESLIQNEHNPYQAQVDEQIDRILARSTIIEDPTDTSKVHNIREAVGRIGGSEASLVLGYTTENQRRISMHVTSKNGSVLEARHFTYYPETSELSTGIYVPTGADVNEIPDRDDFESEEEFNAAFNVWAWTPFLQDLEQITLETQMGLDKAISTDDWEAFLQNLSEFEVSKKRSPSMLKRIGRILKLGNRDEN